MSANEAGVDGVHTHNYSLNFLKLVVINKRIKFVKYDRPKSKFYIKELIFYKSGSFIPLIGLIQ